MAEILEAVRSGNVKAMRALYDSYAGMLYAFCCRYVADDEAAKDVVQEVFIKIFDRIHTFEYRGDSSLTAWVRKIALNESLHYLRDNGGVVFVNIEDLEVAEEETDVTEIPASEIFRMVRKLPDGLRTVFNLRAIEGKSHSEIAKMLNISVSTSTTQYYRAKMNLAKYIRQYNRERNG
ncbi:MAG: RNA polymerase sigma factor [Muribaculaceae bacterium]